ncbi:MAG TPA: hypothetical protein VJG66_01000 [Patescibacteria group bacterium]|nr:hypothetical protein [Patescibacteria group bacterium]
MLKYDHQLTEVKSRLPAANRILIVISQNLTTDNLAAGLALYLSLKSSGKRVDVVSTGIPLVGQSNLFGIGDVKNEVAKGGGGNFIISLDGVVDSTGTMQQVPALEKLDWYPEGSKLNLVFHVVPGQRFVPTNITSRHEESGYDLTVVIGCQSLNELGNLFISNSQYFAQSQVINIDINPLNSYFGFANIIDPQASSLSEIVAHVLPSLTLSMDLDVASNIIAGIYSATNNLTQKVNPDTFLAVSQAVQVGGTLPGNPQPQAPAPEIRIDYQPQPEPQPQPTVSGPENTAIVNTEPAQPAAPQPVVDPAPAPDMFQASLQSSPFIVPPQNITIPVPPPASPVQPEAQPAQSQFQFSQPFASAQGKPSIQSQPASVIPQGQAQGFDLRQIFQIPQMASGAVPANPQTNQQPAEPVPAAAPQPIGGGPEKGYEMPPQAQVSPEERPMGEFATSPSPEIESTPTPDWLVPKIFKGGNLG